MSQTQITQSLETKVQRVLVEYGLQDEWNKLHFFQAVVIMPKDPSQQIADAGGYVFNYAGNVNGTLIATQNPPPDRVTIITKSDLPMGAFNLQYVRDDDSVKAFMTRSRTIITESGDVFLDPDGNFVELVVKGRAREWHAMWKAAGFVLDERFYKK